jgi:drug/metabolite transporter (DMT)-like permease
MIGVRARPVNAAGSEDAARHRRDPRWLRPAKWIGTAAGVAGAVLIALNLGVTGYGFLLFLVSSLLWSAAGWMQRDGSLVVLQVAFTAINVMGIVRWLGA